MREARLAAVLGPLALEQVGPSLGRAGAFSVAAGTRTHRTPLAQGPARPLSDSQNLRLLVGASSVQAQVALAAPTQPDQLWVVGLVSSLV